LEEVSVVFAIKDNNRQYAWKIQSLDDTVNALTAIRRYPTLTMVLMIMIAASIVLTSGPATASDFMVPVRSIAQIRIDDDNRVIDYPVAVFFDPAVEETYLINGGRNRVVVYGPDFFPRASIGGRDVITPRGVTVLSTGQVYLCQVRTYKNPRNRITILNGAFFVEREIFLDEIPETEDLRPRNLAINSDGVLYMSGDNFRGIVVLDNEGNFLRLLQPMDRIVLRGEEAKEKLELEETLTDEEILLPGEDQEVAPEEDIYADIPEEFRPRTNQEIITLGQEVLWPVKINYVTRDSSGKLYLLSAESGKIYVYGPDEEFLFSFGKKGGSPGQMSNPRALVIDEEMGVIYVVDYMRHTILAYNLAGEYIFEFGGRGSSPGWFNFPNDLAINNQGQLIVADLFNRRVQVLEVGKEGILYYMDKSTAESKEGTSDTFESSVLDEPVTGEPEILGVQENIPEALPERPDREIDQGNETEAPLVFTDGVIEEQIMADVELSTAAADTTDFAAVKPFIESWIGAWEQKDIEAYLSHYSPNFITPEGISLAAWKTERQKSFGGRQKWTKIKIRNMEIRKVDDAHAEVTFIQEYKSDTYSEVVKTLELIWENGSWMIGKETSKGLQESAKPEGDIASSVPSNPPEQPVPAEKPKVQASPAVESLAKSQQPSIPAAYIPDFAAVEPFIESWIGAWEQKDIEAYLSHYSPNFITPEGISLAAWEIQRHKSFGRPKWIKIEIRNMQIRKVDDAHASVTFIQEYKSDTYSDKVVKTLDILWENGSWMIGKETSKAL